MFALSISYLYTVCSVASVGSNPLPPYRLQPTRLLCLLLNHIQFTLIHGPNSPGSYEILFFTALDLTFTTRHSHNWISFPLLRSLFLIFGAISLILPSSKLYTYQPGGLIFQCHIFLPFHTDHGVLEARILEWFAVPFSSGPFFVRWQ